MHSKFTKLLFLILPLLFNTNSLFSQASPWGTGSISNQLIGNVVDTTVVFASQSGYGNYGYYPNPNSLLPTYTYDIYIPATYDGTEAYGLVTFINSGNNGGLISSWAQVLDEKKLILIAGDNIGNSINVNIRMGVAMAAVYRLKEVLNIDSTRIYTSGNSGGGRMGSVLAYTYPEWFFGSVPNCGSSYLRQVAQDYETQNPNSHYEYTIPFSNTHLNYVRSFDRRYGILTSFDDFREGDIMNIYHNGMVQDEIKGKFLETAGPHCATTTEHFRDAINFVEHPHISHLMDNFDSNPLVGDGFKSENASVLSGALVMEHSDSSIARAYSRNPFKWNDEKGSIFDTSIQLDSTSYNQNSLFHLALYDYDSPELFCDKIGTECISGLPSIITKIAYNNSSPTLFVVVENPNQSLVSDTIFQAAFSDWYASDTLDIRYHIWNEELRIEFSNHCSTPVISSLAAKLLDDNRSVRIRWDDFALAGSYWGTNDWQKGSLLTFASQNINSASTSTFFSIDHVSIIAADTSNILAVPQEDFFITQAADTLYVDNGFGPYQWYLDNVALPADTSDMMVAVQNGNYTVSLYSGTPCEVVSDTVNVNFTNFSNIDNPFDINIYPNPNAGNFIIESAGNLNVQVLDALGRIVYAAQNIDTLHRVGLKNMASGIYFVRLIQTEGELEYVYTLQVE